MPKISAAAASERRAAILNAARACFAEHGIHVSVDEICVKAGVSKGAFYLYFDSKDAAIEALALDHERNITGLVELHSLDDLIAKLVQVTTGRSVASNRLELETWVHSLNQPALRAALQHNADSLQRTLATTIGASAGAKPKAGISVALAAEIVTIFTMGLIASSALTAGKPNRSAELALKALIGALLSERLSPRAPRARQRRRAQRS